MNATRQLFARVARHITPSWVFRATHRNSESFMCSVCGYRGPFRSMRSFAGVRAHAQCPHCNALERHRLQMAVMSRVLRDFDGQLMLHVAPEPFMAAFFRARFPLYETADLEMRGVTHRVDLQSMPQIPDGQYDLVFASHVLEHIPDDLAAIREIHRILAPGGMAVLPVPIVCEKTVEYPAPNPTEAGHVRAPGLDYYRKYEDFFARVEVRSSADVNPAYQPFVYEDRSVWPNANCPLRPPMPGTRHLDFVPICWKA